MSRFVRQSKYRHVFGKENKPEECYQNIKVSRSAWDTNKVTANTKFLAVIWDAAGGGAFCVRPLAETGKGNPTPALITGHKAEVLDIEFSPLNESLIASASEDCFVKIWSVPADGIKTNMTEAVQTLRGHGRKVGTVNFSHTAANVLATSSTDYTVKLWDIEKGAEKLSVPGHSNIIQQVSWNTDASLLSTTSKDKKMRILDPRAAKVVTEFNAHEGVKGFRGMWLQKKEQIFTVGFSKNSQRQFFLWDPKKPDQPIHTTNIDTAAGQIMPFFDEDSSIVYLAGKGDGNIRYYEVTDGADNEFVHFITEYKSATAQQGMCTVPKRCLDISGCEIDRVLKVTSKGEVIPISFRVPRKSDGFQDDIFPDCFSGEAALTADAWFAGENHAPKTIGLKDGYKAPEKVADFNPVVQKEEVLTEADLRKENEKLKQRVAYLEAEIVKRDARIKELGGQ